MKQITLEVKMRVFALYWKQKIWTEKSNPKCLAVVGACIDFDPNDSYEFDDAVLLVKPLSSITDEDAITLAEILGKEPVPGREHLMLLEGKAPLRHYNATLLSSWKWSGIIDFLRSRGYALTAFGYSVNELVEAGVFKLKEEQK